MTLEKTRGKAAPRRSQILLLALIAAVLALTSCSDASSTTMSTRHRRPPPATRQANPPTTVAVANTTTTAGATPSTSSTAVNAPLAGMIVGVDPGHNGLNYEYPAVINKPVWNGREYETCNTTGTETDSGYTEAQFNWNVSQYLETDLQSQGARVVLTRSSNDGVGPCVNIRAQIMNSAKVNVAIAIHADGGPPTGRGFAVLEPVADGPNDNVISSSAAFGAIVRNSFASVTGMPVSTYDGSDGVVQRNDLAGTNLTTVPYVLIECGNMRNSTDAGLLITASFQQLAARALADAIVAYLHPSG